MNLKKAAALLIMALFAVSAVAQMGKKPPASPRGTAELKAEGGNITIEYGRPSMSGPALKGSDPLSQFQVGQAWRMGANQATILTTPVDLAFGSTKLPKGSYSLFLKRTEAEKFDLIFNSQTGQWGLQHDASKDVAQVPMKKDTLKTPVELFTIDLKPAPNGGALLLSWGTAQLSSDFTFAK